jgi:hypothetical protein
MAHPFSAMPLGFSVMGARTLCWGGCARDSFALPHLLSSESEVLVATRREPSQAAAYLRGVGWPARSGDSSKDRGYLHPPSGV